MKREIGSFIGLDLRNSGEYFKDTGNIARLNSARAGIYHSCRLYNCNSILIPYYLCPTVKNFILKKGLEVESYFINETFEPVNVDQKKDQAILLVNYFGILSQSILRSIAQKFRNVIIDNSAAFFADPVEDCYNVYSPRKFFGVPDGCYVIGEYADRFVSDYEQDSSSGTSSFLLKKIEYGTNAVYPERMKNEERIDGSDILNMSLLTKSLLCNIDYSAIKAKRKENFRFAYGLYNELNLVDLSLFIDEKCIPMVYPLVLEDAELALWLKERNIYVGRLWAKVLTEVPGNSFEATLSKYLLPLPVDQGYEEEDILFVYKTILAK